jgi:GMP synthase (glutamine-hydrolysing)
MRLRRVLFALVFITCLLTSAATASATKADEAAPQETGQEVQISDNKPLEASSTWIVVNLFTGRTSKQAELVRTNLAKLGAEGQGIVLPYREITLENMRRLKPAFLALSPNGIPWCQYKGRNGEELREFFQALRVIVEEMGVPTIGICGGHQAMAIAFGGKVGPISGGEDDCFRYGGHAKEHGRRDLAILTQDPIFQGMGPTINLVQDHYDEVKKIPPGFVCLADNKLCKYQIIRHPTMPAYGVQAHTEYSMKSRPDGGNLLKNFLNIAKAHNRLTRNVAPGSKQNQVTSEKKNQSNRTTPW